MPETPAQTGGCFHCDLQAIVFSFDSKGCFWPVGFKAAHSYAKTAKLGSSAFAVLDADKLKTCIECNKLEL